MLMCQKDITQREEIDFATVGMKRYRVLSVD